MSEKWNSWHYFTETPKPVAAYVPGVKVEKYIYTAGQIPFVNGELKYKGKVGKDVSVEDAYEAAKLCVLNCLSIVKSLAGSIDNIEKVVKVVGFVNVQMVLTNNRRL